MFKAYDETQIRNQQVQLKAKELLESGLLSPSHYEQVLTNFPIHLKQGNVFVRIGLFLFTSLCIWFSIMFLTWILGIFNQFENFWGAFLLFCGISLTALNEFFIRSRQWYRQGSDNALCYSSIMCFISGIGFLGNFYNFTSYAIIFMVLTGIAAWRYGDPIAALGSFCALLTGFVSFYDANTLPVFQLPLIGGILSVTFYFFARFSLKQDNQFYWEDCFKILEIVSLTTLYGSINYYIVDSMHYNSPDTGIPSPYNYIFIFLTTFLPLLYLIVGVQSRNRILWIMGSLGIIASILTFRHYNAVMPLEWALTLAGLTLLVLAFALIHYLKTPRNSIVYQPERNKNSFVETLIVNQFLPQSPSPQDDTVRLGGGDFGGGGASDTY